MTIPVQLIFANKNVKKRKYWRLINIQGNLKILIMENLFLPLKPITEKHQFTTRGQVWAS
jgi:hypothetical protein